MSTDTCESIAADPKLIALLRLEGEMRRDLDYMRQMLLDMEASDEWQHELGLDDDDDPVRDYHVMLLCDEGFLERIQPGIYRMTGKAHDFIDHTRDQGIWEKSKVAAGHLKDHSVSMLMRVAEGYVRGKIREITGLDI